MLAGQPRARVFQPPPVPELSCTPKGQRRLLVLHRDHPFLFNVSSTSFLASGAFRDPEAALVVDELVEDGESLGTTSGSNFELSRCCRKSCNVTFAERKEPSRDVFPRGFSLF